MLASLAPVVQTLVLLGALGSLALSAVPVAQHFGGRFAELPEQSAAVGASAPAAKPIPPDLGPILDLAPFGAVEVPPPPEVSVGETTLDLVLHGVVLQNDPDASTAFIFHDGSTISYRPGDTITGNARLREVASDRVVLEVDGGLQILSFPDPAEDVEVDDYADEDIYAETNAESDMQPGSEAEPHTDPVPDVMAPGTEVPALSGPERLRQMVASQTEESDALESTEDPEPESPEAGNDAEPRTMQDRIDLWRERINANPQDALDSIGLIPADNGYSVAEQHDSDVDQAGLQAGDVITSVNGQAVGDIDRDRQLFDEVVASGQARIEVQRDGRTLVLTFPLQ